MNIKEEFPIGTQVIVNTPCSGKERNATVIGHGSSINPQCVRVRFDGKKEPHTIHRDFIRKTIQK